MMLAKVLCAAVIASAARVQRPSVVVDSFCNALHSQVHEHSV